MRKPTLLLALLGLAATACVGDRDPAFDRPRVVDGPIPLKDRVAYVDGALDRVVLVDADPAAPTVASIPVGRRPIWSAPDPQRDHLLVITRGEEALTRGQVDQDPMLWYVDVANPDAEPIAYPIGSPFDRIAVSDDGGLAVLHFSSSGPDAEGFFRNPNELAFVDLTRPPGPDNPVLKTLRSFGSAPSQVVLSPPMAVPGAEDPTPRTFAFVLALNRVTVVDATHPDRDEVTIRLDQAGAQVDPREVVFAPNAATAYLRSDGARDVLEVLIGFDPPADDRPSANDYRTVLAELGAGGGPADIAVYDDVTGRRFVLAATPATSEIVVIDADTAEFVRVPVPDPVDRIVLFPFESDVIPQKAVLASLGSPREHVHVLDLDGIDEDLIPRDVDTVEAGAPVRAVEPVPGRELALLVHDDQRTVLGLLDVAYGSVSPLQGVARLDSYAFTPSGDYLVAATSGLPRLGLLELANLHPSDLRLDDEPAQIFALHNGALFVDHADPLGRATIVPDPTASRDDAIVLSGFLLAGLLQEP
jgi:hypothetical protein